MFRRPMTFLVLICAIALVALGVAARLAQTAPTTYPIGAPLEEKVGAPDPGLLPGHTARPVATEVPTPVYDSEGWIDPATLAPDMRVLQDDQEVVAYNRWSSTQKTACLVRKHEVVQEAGRTSERGSPEVLVFYPRYQQWKGDPHECDSGVFFFIPAAKFDELERTYNKSYELELQHREEENSDFKLIDRIIKEEMEKRLAATPTQ